jgi:RNA polymerase sigma factor (sigma-70 family)
MATSPMSEVIQHLHRTALLQDGAGLTDGQLLEDYLSRRDEAALAALVRRHGPMVWGVCRRVLHNHHDAEDAFQATFLVFVRKAASIAARELLANWLYGVAHQTARKARATAAKRQVRERQVTEMPEPAVAEQDLWQDLQPLLDEALSRLPDKYRSVLVLCDLEGKTRKEAARQLGVPEGTVAGWLARARALLAKRLARHGLAVTGGALAAVLSPNAASAGVPASVMSSTIEAASLFAAGQAAATGAVSVKVAALTEGVLKTMRMTKLKIAMAILFVASTVALTCGVLAGQHQPGLADDGKAKPQIKPAEPPKEDKDTLQGTWRIVTAEVEGVVFGEGRPEIKDNRLTFEKSSVTLSGKIFHSPQVKKEPEDFKGVGTFTLETTKDPRVIVLTWETNPWNDKKDFTQRGVYALEGESLKLCLPMANEDKQPLPTEFSAKFGSKRSLWTLKRDPAPEKGGEKQQPPGLPDDGKAKAQSKPAGTPKEDKDTLQGTWRLVTAETDGLRSGEGRPELKDHRLIMEKSSFTFFYTPPSKPSEPGNTTKAVGTFTVDTTKDPRVIVLTWETNPWNDKKDFTQRGIYALEGESLKLCLSLDEGDKNPPTEFSTNVGSKRSLWTFKRDPVSEKGGDQKKP